MAAYPERSRLVSTDQQDEDDIVADHPFMNTPRTSSRSGILSSSTFKTIAFAAFALGMGIMIGLVIVSNQQLISQHSVVDTSTANGETPAQHPAARPLTTKKHTPSNPALAPVQPAPSLLHTIKSIQADKMSLQSRALSTMFNDAELKNLQIEVDVMTVKAKSGLQTQSIGPLYGAYLFTYKYPVDEDALYDLNEIRRTCFHVALAEKSTVQSAMIRIVFRRFDLENGFDRVLIRHFNDSFIDLPRSYSGFHQDLTIEYVLNKQESQSICIEMQSDETVAAHGIEYDVSVQYDLCEWSAWDPCWTMNLWGRVWSRGPFMNGKCGLGITWRHRSNATQLQQDEKPLDGVVLCSNTNISNVYGPEYCIKRKCEDYDNYHDPEFDPARVPGQGWYNRSRYYNGAGRIDPEYPDPFRLYVSSQNNLFTDFTKKQWIEKLIQKLNEKSADILSTHQHANILKYGILDSEHKNRTMEYLGAKVIYSLINGVPFMVALSGDSVTSGHDNMFMTTYPMQLQSRLRRWWTETGNKGATFATRNFACGGGMSSDSQGFMPIAMVTETFPDAFNPLMEILESHYDEWYRSAYPIHTIDVELFEYHFTEGGGTQSSRELHVRESAYLDAIWGALNPIGGVPKVKDACKPWEEVEKGTKIQWTTVDAKKYQFMTDSYLENMGVTLIVPDHGLFGACPLYKNGTVKLDASSKHDDDGLPPDGMKFAYSNWWFRVNWHPSSHGHRVMSDIISYWIISSAIQFMEQHKDEMKAFASMSEMNSFLKEKKGDWRNKLVQSIKDQKHDEFVAPTYCARKDMLDSEDKEAIQYNDYCESIPFAITNIKPMIYNSHSLMQEYLYRKHGDTRTFTEYIAQKGWTWSTGDSIISIDRKEGTEGNMDTFWFLKPNKKFFEDKLNEWKRSQPDITEDEKVLDKFHQYLIDNEIYLQFVVKVPKFGSGRIKFFNGYHCDAWLQHTSAVRVYVNALDTVKQDKTGKDLGRWIENKRCIGTDFEADTKYVVSYVPMNVTSKSTGRWQPGFDSFSALYLFAY